MTFLLEDRIRIQIQIYNKEKCSEERKVADKEVVGSTSE
jgi:hypothetical protein